MAMLIFLAVAWISLLHQQVGRRTRELSAANQSLTGEIAERRRMENELVRTRLQHMVEQERTRIARDLHDDLGSRLTRIVLLLDELVLHNSVPSSDAPEHPVEICAAAKEVIQSLDETVWAVNPRNDTLPHLLNYLSHSAIEFLKAANVRCLAIWSTMVAASGHRVSESGQRAMPAGFSGSSANTDYIR
jgi:signal transduction histidine kinase